MAVVAQALRCILTACVLSQLVEEQVPTLVQERRGVGAAEQLDDRLAIFLNVYPAAGLLFEGLEHCAPLAYVSGGFSGAIASHRAIQEKCLTRFGQ